MFREPFLPEAEDDARGPSPWAEGDEPYTRYAATKPAVDERRYGPSGKRLRPVETGPRRRRPAGLPQAGRGRTAARRRSGLAAPARRRLPGPSRRGLGEPRGLLRRAPGRRVLRRGPRAGGRGSRRGQGPLQAPGAVPGPQPARPLRRRAREPVPARPRPPRHPQHRGGRRGLLRRAGQGRFRRSPDRRMPPGRRAGGRRRRRWAVTWTGFPPESRTSRSWRAACRGTYPKTTGSSSRAACPCGTWTPTRRPTARPSPSPPTGARAASTAPSPPRRASRGASERPVTLLIGDLALLHDLNSLAMLRDVPVVVVVLNNDGGGIFSFLPVAEHKEFFEPYFGTPQGVGFGPAAEMFGLDYEQPGTTDEFLEAYRRCLRERPFLHPDRGTDRPRGEREAARRTPSSRLSLEENCSGPPELWIGRDLWMR